MDGDQKHCSEVARLLKQIGEEYESALQGLSGLARGTSQHEFITKKMENMGKLQNELETLLGGESTIAMVVARLETISETGSSSIP